MRSPSSRKVYTPGRFEINFLHFIFDVPDTLAQVYPCMHIYMCTLYIYIYVFMYTHTYVYVYTCLPVYIRVHTHIHVHPHTYVYIYTRAHPARQARVQRGPCPQQRAVNVTADVPREVVFRFLSVGLGVTPLQFVAKQGDHMDAFAHEVPPRIVVSALRIARSVAYLRWSTPRCCVQHLDM